MSDYNIPFDIETIYEDFYNDITDYHIYDYDKSGDNIFAMELFIECVRIHEDEIIENHGTQIVIQYEEKDKLIIDSMGHGDFHLHGYSVSKYEED